VNPQIVYNMAKGRTKRKPSDANLRKIMEGLEKSKAVLTSTQQAQHVAHASPISEPLTLALIASVATHLNVLNLYQMEPSVAETARALANALGLFVEDLPHVVQERVTSAALDAVRLFESKAQNVAGPGARS
jgi:hypothetical protein